METTATVATVRISGPSPTVLAIREENAALGIHTFFARTHTSCMHEKLPRTGSLSRAMDRGDMLHAHWNKDAMVVIAHKSERARCMQ